MFSCAVHIVELNTGTKLLGLTGSGLRIGLGFRVNIRVRVYG